MLAIAVVTPLRAFAQTPPPAPEAAPAAPPAEAAPPPAPMPPPPPAVVVEVPPAVPAAAPAAAGPKLTWGGLVDTYYMYYFNPPSGSNSLTAPTSAVVGRAFDTNSNSMTIALSKVSLNASMDPVTFQLDVGYGTTATIVNGAPMPGTQSPSFFVEQAYGSVALPGNFSLDFGKFVTTAGAEVIEANKNWLYSRSLLFNIIPFVHVGARANLKVSDQLTLQASVVNNWGGVGEPDNNAWKTAGVSATVTISPLVTVIATGYFGKEATQPAAGSTPGDLTILADVVGAFTLSDKLGLNVNFDYIKAPPATASSDDYQMGVSAMGRFVASDHLTLAARGEYLKSKFSGISVAQEEVTVGVALPVGKNFELRPEVRADLSGDPIFAGEKSMVTGTVAALTYF
jgi:hypothetical protein